MRPGSLEQHPDLGWRAYHNFAAVGPLPLVARAAVAEAVDLQGRLGVDGIGPVADAARRARDRFATLLGAEGAEVALLGSTSDGVVAVARSFPWRAGDRVLLLEGEFPANVTPWLLAARDHGLEVVWLPADAFATDEGLERLEAELRRGLRLVAFSAVQFRTGLRMPVEAITALAHAHGAEVFVDAIQAAGSVPLRAGKADWVACGGHKWLMGPLGTGLLLGRSEGWAALRPTLSSWQSHPDPFAFLVGEPGRLVYDRPIADGPAKVEGGGRNLLGHVALAASLGLLLETGVEALAAHVQALHDRLEPELVARGFRSLRSPDPTRRSGLLCLEPPPGRSAGELARGLAERGVSVATPDGLLRFSPGICTTHEQVDVTLGALDEVLR